MTTKTCTGCKETLPISSFGKDSRKKDGYRIYCRDCVREQAKAKERRKHQEWMAERKRVFGR